VEQDVSTQRQSWSEQHFPRGFPQGEFDILGRRSLPAAWVEQWRRRPDVPVVHDAVEGWLTGSDLLRRSESVAARLSRAGVRRGDRVLLSGSASAHFVIAHVALMRAGMVVVPVNSAYTRRELEVLIEDAEPRAAILERDDLRNWATDTAQLLVVGLDVDLPDGDPPTLDDVGPDDPALLPYTSGTTGRPKGALLNHGNLLASAEAVRIAWRWNESDRLILCLPLFHMHGLGVGLHGTLLTGASAILQERFDPETVLDAAEHDATLFFGVPTMYARLIESPGASRLAGLRLCVSGSAPLSAALHDSIRERCGQTVLERYGMTETVMLVSNPYEGERRPGSVGFPLPGVELRLDGDGAEDGEILVRGPNVFTGYLGHPEANDTCFVAAPDGDHWFRTGDIGHVDDDGYVSIVGRCKELIISGGFNVYPREVEDVLREHPHVVDVAVVGTPSDEWGEIVTAFVETDDDDFAVTSLTEWSADRLVSYKRPRLVHRVSALPRNSLGKVVRGELSATPPATS
jgi:malonyl-CoA/methylmalonyl-CoA synthetase